MDNDNSNIINSYLKKKKILLLIILLLIAITHLQITNKTDYPTKFLIIKKNKEYNIGTLIIKKINLEENLYALNSNENNVEKHITILKESIFPPTKDSIVFLAAHSGTGNIAYFERLDELKIDDEVVLIYKNKKYIYRVKNSWEEKKNGYININKDTEDQLILTTCSPNKKNYQLIINCIKKKSNQ